MLFVLAVVLGLEIADFLVPKWGLPPCSFNSYLYMFQYGVSPQDPLRSFHKLIMCLCCHMPRLVEVVFLWNSVIQFPRRLLQLQQNPKEQKRQNQTQRRKKLARQKQMLWKRSKKQQRRAMPRMFVCHEVMCFCPWHAHTCLDCFLAMEVLLLRCMCISLYFSLFLCRLLQLQQNPKQQKRQNQTQRRKKLARQKQMPWKRSTKQQRLAMPRMFVCHEVMCFCPWHAHTCLDCFLVMDVLLLRCMCISLYFSLFLRRLLQLQQNPKQQKRQNQATHKKLARQKRMLWKRSKKQQRLAMPRMFVMKSCVFAPDMHIPVWIVFLWWTFCFFDVCVFHCISHYFSAGCSSCRRTQSSRSTRTKPRDTRNWRGKSRCRGRGQRNSRGELCRECLFVMKSCVFAPDMPIPVWIVFLWWTFCFFDVCVFHCISHYFSAGCSSCSRTQSSRSARTKPRDTRNWRGKSRCRGRGQPNSRGELCRECLFVMKSCVFAPDMPIPVWIVFLWWTFCFFDVCVFSISLYFSLFLCRLLQLQQNPKQQKRQNQAQRRKKLARQKQMPWKRSTKQQRRAMSCGGAAPCDGVRCEIRRNYAEWARMS